MWISKKRWESLEKRIADLEVQVQGQQNHLFIPEDNLKKYTEIAKGCCKGDKYSS